MILWVDVETTGLDARKDLLLEVAAVMTDDKLVELDAFTAVVDNAKRVNMREVDPVVQQMHAKNGLWSESLLSGQCQITVDEMLRDFVLKHCPGVEPGSGGAKDGPQLGGSTVNFDRAFLQVCLPISHTYLHYRNVDVSTVNELARRFWPSVHENRPREAEVAHRALPDVRLSIQVARWYARMLVPMGTLQVPLAMSQDPFAPKLW